MSAKDANQMVVGLEIKAPNGLCWVLLRLKNIYVIWHNIHLVWLQVHSRHIWCVIYPHSHTWSRIEQKDHWRSACLCYQYLLRNALLFIRAPPSGPYPLVMQIHSSSFLQCRPRLICVCMYFNNAVQLALHRRICMLRIWEYVSYVFGILWQACTEEDVLVLMNLRSGPIVQY